MIIAIIILLMLVLWLAGAVFIMLNAGKYTFDTEKSKNTDYGDLKYITDYIQNKEEDTLEIMVVPNSKIKDVILYFHGNSGRVPYIISEASKFGTVIAPSYPGWGKSSGTPSSDKIYETVDIVIQYLKERKYNLSLVSVLGHSMGGSPSIYAGTKYPELQKIVVVNTFYSMQAMCETKYSFFCILGGNFLNSAKYAPFVKTKYIQFNNVNDLLIPYEQASRLFEKIGRKDKKYFDIEGTHGKFDITKVLSIN